MDNQNVRHICYQVLEVLVFPFAAIALHFDGLGLTVEFNTGLKLYELLLS